MAWNKAKHTKKRSATVVTSLAQSNKATSRKGMLTTVGELLGEVGDLGHVLHSEDLVHEVLDLSVFHFGCLSFYFAGRCLGSTR